jgi:hypothetical protein
MSTDIPGLSGSSIDASVFSSWFKGSQTPKSSIQQVVALTERIFGGPCKVTIEDDPEIENLRSLVFNATTSLAVDEVVSHSRRWHREVKQLVQDSRNFRLSIDIHDAKHRVS